jgi:hypothetical protein
LKASCLKQGSDSLLWFICTFFHRGFALSLALHSCLGMQNPLLFHHRGALSNTLEKRKTVPSGLEGEIVCPE